MPICPSCHSEYRAGFTRCASCDVELVSQEQFEQAARKHGSPKEALADVEILLIPQPSLTAARELEGAILKADIPCYTHVAEADTDVALGSAAALQFAVVIAQADLERVKAAMKERFEEMIASEGFGQLQTDAIDLEAEEVTCPACGHSGPLVDGECADCGLMLGAV